MTSYVVLLRGINVGGHAKVAMDDLRQLFTDLGRADVKTYIYIEKRPGLAATTRGWKTVTKLHALAVGSRRQVR